VLHSILINTDGNVATGYILNSGVQGMNRIKFCLGPT
jgi:hypothetical protein